MINGLIAQVVTPVILTCKITEKKKCYNVTLSNNKQNPPPIYSRIIYILITWSVFNSAPNLLAMSNKTFVVVVTLVGFVSLVLSLKPCVCVCVSFSNDSTPICFLLKYEDAMGELINRTQVPCRDAFKYIGIIYIGLFFYGDDWWDSTIYVWLITPNPAFTIPTQAHTERCIYYQCRTILLVSWVLS